MAIPVETSDGNVWVTDHQYNRISEFDPVSGTFLQSLVMPTSSCWVVQGHEDVSRGQVYFTEYNANQLGRIDLGGSTVTDISVPGGGPAFCVYSDDQVYYSRWSEPGIGALDVVSGGITEYQFPQADENGGPLWLMPDGRIVCGTRNRGYVMVFDPVSEDITPFMVPTPFPGFKDGMTVAPDGTIWFTESGVNKLGKLIIVPPPCPGDLEPDGDVNVLDLLILLNDWGPCPDPPDECPADLDDTGVVDVLDLIILLANWGDCPQ